MRRPLPRSLTGLRARLLGLCIVAVLPIVVLAVWQAASVRSGDRDDLVAETVRLSRAAATRLSGELGEVATAVDASLAVGAPESGEDPCVARTAAIRRLQPSVVAAFVTSASGEIVCLDGDGPSALAGRTYLEASAQSAEAVFGTEPSGVFDGDPVAVAVRPITATEGWPGSEGLLVGTAIEFDTALVDFTSEFGLPAAATTMVLDHRGVVVASSTGSGEGRRVPIADLVEQIGAGAVEGTIDEAGSTGAASVVSYADVLGTDADLFTAVSYPSGTTDAAIVADLRTQLLLAAAVLVVALIGAFALAEISITRPLRSMRDRLDRIGHGDLEATTEHAVSMRELSELDAEIDLMVDNLAQRAASLQLAADERHRLLDELLTVQEEERRKIAADIHDDTIQSMIASGLAMQMLRHEVDSPDALARLRTVEERISAAIARLRQLMFELEPVGSSGDLAVSVEHYLGSAVDASVELTVSCTDLVEPSGPSREVLFRNMRECVLNAMRHGAATAIDVEITSVNGGVEVIVADNGSGMVPSASRKAGHHGMRVMKERVEALGGHLVVESEPGSGTTVLFWIPLATSAPLAPARDDEPVEEDVTGVALGQVRDGAGVGHLPAQ